MSIISNWCHAMMLLFPNKTVDNNYLGTKESYILGNLSRIFESDSSFFSFLKMIKSLITFKILLPMFFNGQWVRNLCLSWKFWRHMWHQIVETLTEIKYAFTHVFLIFLVRGQPPFLHLSLWNLNKNDKKELINTTETNSETSNSNLWLPWEETIWIITVKCSLFLHHISPFYVQTFSLSENTPTDLFYTWKPSLKTHPFVDST